MPLSCDCNFPGGFDEFDWLWFEPSDYTEMPYTGRRKRCCSCSEFITVGDDCGEFRRERRTTEFECEQLGWDEGAPIASWWMCGECLGLFYSLRELGYCFDIDESMRSLVREYAEQREPT